MARDELLGRLERLERAVEEHGKRLDALVPKGGPRRDRKSRSPAPRAEVPRGPSLYVIGGHASGQTLDVVQRYDAQRGWELLPCSKPRHGCAACSTSGVVYVLGGADDRSVPLGDFERFDPETSSWEPLPAMPTARHGAACCAVAGVVYALGGFDGQTVLGAAERFDPARRGWERLPELPTRRGRCAAAACEGLVFVAGGSDDSSEVAAFEEFQPSKWQWQARPALPTPRAGLGLASTGRSLLALGGKVQGEKLSTVERFDLAQMTWELLKPLSSPRDGCSACGLLGRVYVFGGRGMGTTGNQTLALAECFDPDTGSWTALPMMPHATCGCAAAAAEH